MSRLDAIAGLNAGSYQRHPLHGGAGSGQGAIAPPVWTEKNCYADLWIEVLHALRLEPLAMLPCTLAVDFEGDQWTFFKPSLDALNLLYGIDVQELNVWRPLVEHLIEHLGAGKLISTEADAFWLPDTAGTDYRTQHTKTTILIASLDAQAGQLGYFHNAGYFELAGEDFRQVLRVDADAASGHLPLYAELVRTDRMVIRESAELAGLSLALLRGQLERRPTSNPFLRFGARLTSDLPELQARGLAHYHAWAFASIRQAGAAFDLLAANLRWQAGFGHPALIPAAECFDTIAQGNKALILKGARAVNSGRPFDAGLICAGMAQAWEQGMDLLSTAMPRTTQA